MSFPYFSPVNVSEHQDPPPSLSNPSSSHEYMYTGIFRDERVLQFFHILVNLADSVFLTLDQVARDGSGGFSQYRDRFFRGLDLLLSWKIQVRMEIAQSALEEYGCLDQLYNYTIIRYLKELFKHERRAEIPVHIPPFHEFLYTYYCNLAQSKPMRDMKYFKLYGMEQTHLHMYTMRQTLMQIQPHLIKNAPSIQNTIQRKPRRKKHTSTNAHKKHSHASRDRQLSYEQEQSSDNRRPSHEQAQSRDERRPSYEQTQSSDNRRPSHEQARSRDERRPSYEQTQSSDNRRPSHEQAQSRDERRPSYEQAQSRDDRRPSYEQTQSRDESNSLPFSRVNKDHSNHITHPEKRLSLELTDLNV